MNIYSINQSLLNGRLDTPGLFPKIEQLKSSPVVFTQEFGLKTIPREPGIIIIRGARQLGKSTWLEQKLYETILQEGPGSAFYLNGDEINDHQELFESILNLSTQFNLKAKIKRIFIDEITAIKNWEKSLKRLADQGIINEILIITTGSKTIDLRRGTERLPGRKGKLDRTNFRFTPISFLEFKKKAAKYFPGEKLIWAYVLTGGSPVAINELIREGKIPEYVIELTRDWVFGETSLQGRSIESMKRVLFNLIEYGGLPVSLHTIAEQAALANNTVAQGYIDVLKDLGCLSSVMRLEANKLKPIARKASKHHFTYLLVVTSFFKNRMRTIEDFEKVPLDLKGKWIEWLVAQELWRRAALAGADTPEQQSFWKNDEHEVDFVFEDRFIEVKLNLAQPSDFAWFPKVFPKRKLEVICNSNFDVGFCSSISLKKFLLQTP